MPPGSGSPRVACLPPEMLLRIERFGRTLSYAKGTVIVTEGEASNAFFIIRRGEVKALVIGGYVVRRGRDLVIARRPPRRW
jgi:CRP-like cAMP-binding protein